MTSALWSHAEAEAATAGRATAAWTAGGVSIDSRSVAPGDLFIAIRGDNGDGHRFVGDALAKGAAAAMVAEDWQDVPVEAPLLVVPNTDAGLADLARAARARTAAKIVGVTGSVGKTSTKEMLALAMGKLGKTAATQGNLNNHWGLPLSLARLPRDAEFGVFEIGMNHPGEITPLSRILKPDAAIVTTVESVHLENFESEEAIADAKAEIFAGMGADGAAVLNRDNRHFDRLHGKASSAGLRRICSFGTARDADVRLVSLSPDDQGSDIAASVDDRIFVYRLGAPGKHLATNSLAVLGAIHMLGADFQKGLGALAEFHAMKGRGERRTIRVAHGSFTLIDESYNASPASMRAAIDMLGAARRGSIGRTIAVLGDMLELGAGSDAAHAALAADIARNGVDIVVTAGPRMAMLAKALPKTIEAHHGADSDSIRRVVLDLIRPGDVIMVKGSYGSRMIPIAEALSGLDCDRSDNAAAGRG
ncbi:MAG: UDP-N-acetylmuramoyl-tripeptide--D-alanyl-D-alanine ligase [Alphaproteobacteria bacterium]|nr:UDP-N-acetylmuramoyl-tripeptide--D-alanyl-D-alanine ligase [Alphaproteobacteria bacterium]